jgi:hypothetical protein
MVKIMPRNSAFFLILLATLIGLMVTVIVFISHLEKQQPSQPQQQTTQQATPISGKFDINGVLPEGGTITIVGKNITTQQEKIFAKDLVAADGDAWNFRDAQAGTSYEVQAKVMRNGTVVEQSSPIDVTAPADEETLTLNVAPLTPEPTPNSVISGNIIVNGYIPQNSTISVQGRLFGTKPFKTVAEGLPGEPRQFMSYTTALTGESYEVQAVLLTEDGTNIGTSGTLLVTAPAVNESLTINSSAQPPITPTSIPTATPDIQVVTATPPPANPTPVTTPTPAAISGTINFNGVTPPNTRIVVFEKIYNTQNYQVAVDNITPIDGASWTWTNPKVSTWYDMIAVLKQRQPDGTDHDLATSPVQSVAAPASQVVLTINSSFTLPSPPGPIVEVNLDQRGMRPFHSDQSVPQRRIGYKLARQMAARN